MKSDAASNLLSTPSVMTLDNESASLLVGQEVPITTGEVLGVANTNPFRTVQRQDVGVQLEVKPQINADGAITLVLRQEVSSVAGPVSAGFNELILNKREIETTVLVDDGDIVVLGGLLDQNERLQVDRVPGLGDIPVVGASVPQQRGRPQQAQSDGLHPADDRAQPGGRAGRDRAALRLYARSRRSARGPASAVRSTTPCGTTCAPIRRFRRRPAAPAPVTTPRPEPVLAYGFAKKHGIVVLSLGERAVVGLREGADPASLMEARRALGRPLSVETLARQAFERRLSEVYAGDGLASASGAEALDLSGHLDDLVDDMPAAADLLEAEDDAPIIRLINGLIAEAVRIGASDIHVEPFETALTVRLRVDGVLREMLSLPVRLAPLIVSRIKVMARLDIAEKRLPQDGRMSLALGGKTFDVRVSTLPSRAGERVVMRILDKEQASLQLDELGMTPVVLAAFQAALQAAQRHHPRHRPDRLGQDDDALCRSCAC